MNHLDDDSDSEVEVAIAEAIEEQQRQAAESKPDQGQLTMGDMEMRMVRGQNGGPRPPSQLMPKIRRGTKACNTGPKGVKADYEEAKLIAQFKSLRAAMRAERDLKKKSQGTTTYNIPQQTTEKKNSQQTKPSENDEDEDEDEDDEDDEFFQKYKKEKLELIKNSLPTYGRFYRVLKKEFIQETEREHDLVHIVVHLYKNHIPACIRLNLIFEDLAPQFTHVKFIRCRADDLVDTFSDIALPMLMVYRGGKQVYTIPQVSKYFPEKWQDKEVVEFLAKKGILNQAVFIPPTKNKRLERLKDDY